MLQSLFSSRVRVALLTHFFTHPDERFYARGLTRQTHQHYNAVWQELSNLEQIGLLLCEQEANIKYYRLNPAFPIYEELRRIVLKTTGMGLALQEEIQRLGAVEWAFVYGSVAAGDEHLLSDIDLMVVGEVDLLAFSEVVASLEDRLGREINYVALTRAELAHRLREGDPFVSNVMDGPKIMLIGDEHALRQVGATTADQALSRQAAGD